MLFFVIGPPGGFTEWCTAVTAALASGAGPSEPAILEADTLEALALKAICTGSSHAVVHSQRPGGRLLRALAQAERNFLIAGNDPRSSLIELVLVRGFDLTEAVRLLASSCASLAGVAQVPGALVLGAGRDRAQPGPTVAAVARHLGMRLDDRALAALAAQLAADETPVEDEKAIAWWDGLDPVQQQMTIGALSPYLEPDPIAGTAPITWTGDLFAACDQPGQAASAPIDITGRARPLIEGPCIILPVGAWSLTLTLSCSATPRNMSSRWRLTPGGPLAAATLRPQAEGDAAVRIDFEIGDVDDHPIVIRVSTMRAAFDGVISMVAASLIRAVPT